MALGLVAASGAALLAVGPRLLDEGAFGGLALVWTLSTIFGLGVAAPVEQAINRRHNAMLSASRTAPTRGLWFAACLAVLLIVTVFWRSDAQARFPWLVPGAVVAVVGWTLCAVSRGRLLGAGDLRAYGGSQAVEAAVRGLILAAAVAGAESTWAPAALSAAVGLPLFAGAGWAFFHRHPRYEAVRGSDRHEQLAFVLYALAYQACINALPLLLERKSGDGSAALTGAFVLANSYFRAAAIVVGGILVQALTDLSLAWGRGDHEAFRVILHRTSRRAVAMGLCSTILALAAAPFLLPLLYGGPLSVPLHTWLALGVSTVLVIGAAAQATGLLAEGRPWTATSAWASGAGVMVIVALLLPVSAGILFWAPLAAPLVAIVFAVCAVRVRMHN